MAMPILLIGMVIATNAVNTKSPRSMGLVANPATTTAITKIAASKTAAATMDKPATVVTETAGAKETAAIKEAIVGATATGEIGGRIITAVLNLIAATVTANTAVLPPDLQSGGAAPPDR